MINLAYTDTENKTNDEKEAVIDVDVNESEEKQADYGNGSVQNQEDMELRKRNSQLGAEKLDQDQEDDPQTNKFDQFKKKHKMAIRCGAYAILNLAVFAYFFAALNYWYTRNYIDKEWHFCTGFGLLLILISIVYFFLIYFFIVKKFFGKALVKLILQPIDRIYEKVWSYWYLRIVIGLAIFGALLVFLIVDTEGSRYRLISLGGLVCILLFGYIFSNNRTRIIWRPVLWGLALQFVLGLITIRWKIGRDIFQCLGDKVAQFLEYSKAGSSFVFSDYLVNDIGVFAFAVLSVIFFFSLMIEVMFYWGAMQWVCLKLGWCLQVTLGTTVCESVICAANTFLGMSESPLLIRPYIPDLTKSELHALMSSGFATVSGTVLAAYISFGIEPAHLITASVMSAPAALCYGKLFYPETEPSNTAVSTIKIVKSEDTSALDAAARGASAGINLVLNIAANLIGFVSLIAFINGVLGWLGMLIGWDFLSLEWFFGKIFIPLSFVMGVPWEECEIVGKLIGIKTIVNEFVAYKEMGDYIDAGLLSTRSEVIATYALCGFTNPSSIGIMVGAMSAMAPSRRSDIANVAVRALIAGCAVCFMTACIAGMLISPGAFEGSGNSTSTYW